MSSRLMADFTAFLAPKSSFSAREMLTWPEGWYEPCYSRMSSHPSIALETYSSSIDRFSAGQDYFLRFNHWLKPNYHLVSEP